MDQALRGLQEKYSTLGFSYKCHSNNWCDIYLFGHGVEMVYLTETEKIPAHLRIDDYFHNTLKQQVSRQYTIPSNREVFKVIDDIAHTLGVKFAYIPFDVHQYRLPFGKKIRSRIPDLVHRDEPYTFYERAWQGSSILQRRQLSKVVRQCGFQQVKERHNEHRRRLVDSMRKKKIIDPETKTVISAYRYARTLSDRLRTQTNQQKSKELTQKLSSICHHFDLFLSYLLTDMVIKIYPSQTVSS